MKEKVIDYAPCAWCDYADCRTKHGKRKYRKCKAFKEWVKSTCRWKQVRNKHKRELRKELKNLDK